MTSVHSAAAAPRSRTRVRAPEPDLRSLALRERAVLRLAARQGGVAVTLRRGGRTVQDGYGKLDVLAGLSERGVLRWSGLRTTAEGVEAVYALGGDEAAS